MGDGTGRGEQPEGDQVPAAALAANWRTVLVVDAGMGGVLLVAGLLTTFLWNLYLGALLASCGLAYLLAVGRRGRRWAAIRRERGLQR